MALDKQRILSELGSVMSKLQSADCGCMGKLFSNKGQPSNQGGEAGATMGSHLPTCGGCRRGCCHGHGHGCGHGGHNHGYSAPCAGEPYNNPGMGMQCNPAKLYADTYNYLNTNLMQPVVNEVYQDLKSINPANSVVNNPKVADQMGFQKQGGGAMQGNMGMAQNQMPGTDMGVMQNPNMSMNQQMGNQPVGNQYNMGNQEMGNQQMGNQQMGNQQMGYQQMGNQQMGYQQMGNQQMSSQPMSHGGGMGASIVNMMQGDGSKPKQTGQLSAPMPADASQGQTPGEMNHGQFNAEMSNNASNYGGQQVQSQYMQQQNMNNAMNPNSQNAMGGNMQQNPGNPGASYQVNYSNPAAQQMSSNRTQQNYGKHTPGVTKFNEMFPGVMSGDLGFDPMSIALQMNPANQKQCAMSQMQKLMNESPIERGLESTNARSIQPAVTGANAAAAAMYQTPVNQQNLPPPSQQSIPVQPGAIHQNQGYTNANQPNQAQQQSYGQMPQQQQQVYTALTGAPTMNQNQPPQYQQPPQQYQQQQYQQQQQYMDPNAQAMAAPDLPNLQSSYAADPNASINHQPPQSYNAPPPQSYSSQPPSAADQQMIREPIFPVDTSKKPPPQMKHQKFYDYNTLGQPVEMLPAKLYHPAPDMTTQQTLSPQPITKMRTDQSRFTVKNTVSKTSLMGSRPVGRTPSRGQLQHIYNQYKGSQSYTQQNIRAPGQGATYSEGKINVAQAHANQQRHVPVERIGGDTMANNQMANSQVPVAGQPMGHTGDVLMPVDNKPHGDIAPAALPNKKTRNGLQDIVYTSYPTSAKWSFHGNTDRSPYAPGYRLRR